MANIEARDIRPETELIQGFRDYYAASDRVELPYVPLVSRHDPTIRFTNSTTSVMKPLLRSPHPNSSTTYLAQPAMGTQGLAYWQRSHTFGPYASYFVSLGALYGPEASADVLRDVDGLFDGWNYAAKGAHLEVFAEDEDLCLVASASQYPMAISETSQPFRHSYGEDGLFGRNINIVAPDGTGAERVLGNITLISYGNRPTAYELSFDSPTAASVVGGLRHAVESHGNSGLASEDAIAAYDFATTSAPLLLEGLEPKSRGRGGVLRQFLTELADIRLAQDESPATLQDELMTACESEVAMRAHMLGRDGANAMSLDQAGSIVTAWLPRLVRH